MAAVPAFFVPGFLELLVVLIVWVLPILVIVWLVRAMLQNKRENTRLRLEVGKLADELERTRKQGADRDEGSPP
jgi:hypothetical protein